MLLNIYKLLLRFYPRFAPDAYTAIWRKQSEGTAASKHYSWRRLIQISTAPSFLYLLSWICYEHCADQKATEMLLIKMERVQVCVDHRIRLRSYGWDHMACTVFHFKWMTFAVACSRLGISNRNLQIAMSWWLRGKLIYSASHKLYCSDYMIRELSANRDAVPYTASLGKFQHSSS